MPRSSDPGGFVYVATNPAFPGMCKIGFASDPAARLRVMQTHDPYRGFTFHHLEPTGDRRDVESFIHRMLDTRRYGRTEWYRVHPDTAVEVFRFLRRREQLDPVVPQRRASVPIPGRKQLRDR